MRQATPADLSQNYRNRLKAAEALRLRLLDAGFEATQATISRDIKELGLVKRAGDGAYQRPGVSTVSPEAAMQALRSCAFEPGKRDGQPIVDKVPFVVEFKPRDA